MKKVLTPAAIALVLFALTGCSSNNNDSNSGDLTLPTPEIPVITQPPTMPDIEEEYDEINDIRILSLSPSITSTLVALGLESNLVGLDVHSANSFTLDVPLFDMFNLDMESLIALDPDVIFLAFFGPDNENSPFAPVVNLHDRIHMVTPSDSITHIKEQIAYIGQVTNSTYGADFIIDNMAAEIDRLLDAITSLDAQSPLVYFEIGAEPTVFSFGSGVFLNNIIEMLGGINILSDIDGWIPVAEEVVIDRNPQIILTNVSYLDDPVNTIINRAGWHVIDAIENGNVFLIDPINSSNSNQTIVPVMFEMARAMYQELNLD